MAKKKKQRVETEEQKYDRISSGNYTTFETRIHGSKDNGEEPIQNYIARKQEEERNRTAIEWLNRVDKSNSQLNQAKEEYNVALNNFMDTNPTAFQQEQSYFTNTNQNVFRNEDSPFKKQNNILVDRNFQETEEGKRLATNIKVLNNERIYNQSNLERKMAEDDIKNANPFQKVLYSMMSGLSDAGSILRQDLVDSEGKRQLSYGDTLRQELPESTENKIESFMYKLIPELTKQGAFAALNQLGGLGSVLRFTDSSTDAYNNALLQGYDKEAAAGYGVVVGSIDYVWNKIFTDITKRVGGDAEKGIIGQAYEKLFGSFLKNKNAIDIASTFMSEGTEEFSQEYIERFVEHTMLEVADKGEKFGLDKVFNEETFKNSLESFMIGGLVGGLFEGTNKIAKGKSGRNYDQTLFNYENNGQKLSEQNKNEIAAIIAEYNDKYNKTPSVEEITNTFNNYKQGQIDAFQNNAIELFPNLDEQSRVLYNDLINDISDLIYNTGVNVRFDSNLDTISEWQGNNTLILNPTKTDSPIKTLLLKELSTKLLDNSTKRYILSQTKKNGLYDTLKQDLIANEGFDEANVDNEIIARELNSIFENDNKLQQTVENNKGFVEKVKSTIDNIIKNNRQTKDNMFLNNLNEKLGRIDLNKNNISKNDLKKENKVKNKQTKNQLEEIKKKQLNIIKKNNPMTDDYHTGIRDVKDIKSFKEAYNEAKKNAKDQGYNNYSAYPDITNKLLEDAVKNGKIKIYSSKPITNGVFITPSLMQATDYAGGDKSKVYSKDVNLSDVAWINTDEGQYAPVKINQKNKSNDVVKKVYKATEQLPGNVKEGTYIEPKTPIKEDTKKGRKYVMKLTGEKKIASELDKNYTKFVDKLNPIQQIAEASGNDKLYAKFNNRGMSNGMGQYQIGTAQTDLLGNEIGKSINDIWLPIENAKLTDIANEYLLHRLNTERYSKVPVWDETITDKISQKRVSELEKEYPILKSFAKEVYKFNDNELQKMIDSGITKENARDWLYSNYATISRDLGPKTNPLLQSNKGIKVNSPIRSAKGGNYDIRPMKEAMSRQALLTARATADNIAGLELLNVLGGTVGEKGSYLTQDLEGNNNALTLNQDGTYNYTVYKNGVPITMKITKDIADAIRPTPISEWEDTLPAKAVRGISKIQRQLLTDKNPVFIFTNFFKDIGDAPLNSKHSAGAFYANYPVAVAKMLSKSNEWKQYVARGGKENTYFDPIKGEQKVSKNPIVKAGKGFVNLIENVNRFIEQAPRFNEYLLTLAKGGTIDEALYNSAEITTNFARGGEITKALNRNGFNFLNASVQGFDKQVRNFTNQPGAKGYIQLLAKAIILGVGPAMLNHILLEDDKEYDELQDYVKDNYYLFKKQDGTFTRIPKGRVMAIFGTAARHTYEISQGNEEIGEAIKDTGTQFLNNIAPNNPLENNIISPLISVANNKSWNGSKIVSTSLEKLPDTEQYDEKTSSISKWIGKTFNLSPKKVDYVLDQYSGGIGDFVLPMTTPAAENEVSNPLLAPFVSKFNVDSTFTNKYINKFYDVKDELEKETRTYNSIEDSEETFVNSLRYKYLDTVGDEIGLLYKQKKAIQNSNLDNKEKYQQAKAIQRKIDDLAKFALEDYTEGYYSDAYAQVGDKEFYTNISNGKLVWTKVDEKTKKKQEEYAQKYDMSPDDYYSMKGLTRSTIVGTNEFDFDEINSKLTKIRENTTKDKEETVKYINGLDLSIPQKAMYMRTIYKSFNDYNSEIFNYVNSLNIIDDQKKAILIYLGFDYNKKNNTYSWK